jgi:single-strand DNA-binding protein
MLAQVTGEFGVIFDPEMKFSDKGNAWLKIRGKNADQVRDSNGQWADGKPCFIDILVMGKQAEHLYDSIKKGDTIIVTGKLEYSEWEDNTGTKRSAHRILANQVGVSVRWGTAKTPKGAETDINVSDVKAALGATEISEPPF